MNEYLKGSPMTDSSRYMTKPEFFGQWLIAQRKLRNWIDDLSATARADRSFPKDGDPEAIRAHLRSQQAEGGVFQAMHDSESAWSSQ